MDWDMLALGDISAIQDDIEKNHAASVAKYDYALKVKVKYLGNKQYSYPRKNCFSYVVWSEGLSDAIRSKKPLLQVIDISVDTIL